VTIEAHVLLFLLFAAFILGTYLDKLLHLYGGNAYRAKKALSAVEKVVKEGNDLRAFSRLMADGLDAEHWGTIEPELFREISENNSYNDLTEDARSLAFIVGEALRKVVDGDH
jgi:hypothetical protein